MQLTSCEHMNHRMLTGSKNKHSHETLRVFLSSDVFTSFPSFTGYLAEQLMMNPSCSCDRVMLFWILVVKVRSVFSSIMWWESGWRFQVSWGGECGQGVEAEQLIETDSFSFTSPEISILGFGGESVVSNQTQIVHWKKSNKTWVYSLWWKYSSTFESEMFFFYSTIRCSISPSLLGINHIHKLGCVSCSDFSPKHLMKSQILHCSRCKVLKDLF